MSKGSCPRVGGGLLVVLLAIAVAISCSHPASWDSGPGDGDGDTDTDADGDGDGDVDADADEGVIEESIGPWDLEGADTAGVTVDDGDLVLDAQTSDDATVWIANTGESTVSRLDAESGAEIGRYPSVLLDGSNGAQPLEEPCEMETNGNCPSRTAIDFVGNCYVANRGFGHQGTLTKIARNERDCVDRNRDGELQTSRDADGNGRIDPDDPAEFFPEDECVVWTIDIGERDDRPRAVAVAPDADEPSESGNVWVGLNAAWQAVEVSPDGDVLRTVELPIAPYGAITSKYIGLVWFTTAAWQDPARSTWLTDPRYANNPPAIASVDFRTGEVSGRITVESSLPCVGSYGIGVDAEGRVWLGGEPCVAAFRYDPGAGTWMYVDLSWAEMEYGLTRGIVGDRDGRVWVAHSHCENPNTPDCGLVSSFDSETGGDIRRYELPGGTVGSIGIDLDPAGRIWSVNFNSNTASRIDPDDGSSTSFPVGEHPYTYSDFTGYSLLTQFPRGHYRDVLEVCPGAQWVLADLDATTPDETDVTLRLRVADSPDDLATADWVGPWSDFPADLTVAPGPLPLGGVIEFEIVLMSESGLTTPRVHDLTLGYRCPIR